MEGLQTSRDVEGHRYDSMKRQQVLAPKDDVGKAGGMVLGYQCGAAHAQHADNVWVSPDLVVTNTECKATRDGVVLT